MESLLSVSAWLFKRLLCRYGCGQLFERTGGISLPESVCVQQLLSVCEQTMNVSLVEQRDNCRRRRRVGVLSGWMESAGGELGRLNRSDTQEQNLEDV